MILHRDEWCQVICDSIVLHRMELVGVATGHSNVASITGFDNIVERLHGLCDRCIRVEPMALKDIDVIKLEALQRTLDGFEDVLGGEYR